MKCQKISDLSDNDRGADVTDFYLDMKSTSLFPLEDLSGAVCRSSPLCSIMELSGKRTRFGSINFLIYAALSIRFYQHCDLKEKI